jgi:hypothetical protein
MKWHLNFIQLRKKKRQAALDLHLRQKHANLTKLSFSLWRERSTKYLALQRVAEELGQAKDLDLVEGIFVHWGERTRALQNMDVIATSHYSTQLIGYITKDT